MIESHSTSKSSLSKKADLGYNKLIELDQISRGVAHTIRLGSVPHEEQVACLRIVVVMFLDVKEVEHNDMSALLVLLT